MAATVLDVYEELVASENEAAARDLWAEEQLRAALGARDIAGLSGQLELSADNCRVDATRCR